MTGQHGQAKPSGTAPQDILTQLWQAGDYQGILQQPLTNLGCSVVDGQPVELIAAAVASRCPDALLHAHPIATLRLAYAIIAADDAANARRLLQRVDAGIAALPDGAEKTALHGEALLVESFLHFPQLDKMLATLEQAAQMLPDGARVLPASEPFCFGIQGMVGSLHIKPGRAEQEAELLERFVTLYSALTKGGGSGADALMRAEISFYRGELRQAELLCYKAIYEAEYAGQDTVWMGAQYLLAQIALYAGSADAFTRAMAGMRRAAGFNPENAALCARLLDYNEGLIYAELGQADRVAAWVFEEEAIRLCPRFRSSLGYLAVRCYLCRGENAKVIGMAEAWCNSNIGWGVLVPAVLWILAASAHLADSEQPQALHCLRKAEELCRPDDFTLIFIGAYPGLERNTGQPVLSAGQLAQVKQLYQAHEKGVRLARSALFGASKLNTLTGRELEVAELAARRFSYKEIARELQISENTVKAHLRTAYQKLGVNARAQLAALFRNQP